MNQTKYETGMDFKHWRHQRRRHDDGGSGDKDDVSSGKNKDKASKRLHC
ncbi:MAG: hypothetical protein U0X76_00465 [Bacteroidia bacterium]